jgi:hypothetical protein
MSRIPLQACLIAACSTLMPLVAQARSAEPVTAEGYRLLFDAGRFTVKTSTFEGRTFSYRAYEGIVYVKHPVDAAYQCMNIYIPVEYYEYKSSGDYRADSAPIFLPNSVGGYLPGRPGGPGMGFNGKANAALVALSKGYIVAAPGARGRTNQDAKGEYTGKAPAALVDLKAAVRYLRFNDARMPGNAERIVSNGTSAGGALSALLGATGNHPDYDPYLKALGAAEARDDVFAVSAYCPITNLDYADAAYEWQLCGVNEYTRGFMPPPGGGPGPGRQGPGNGERPPFPGGMPPGAPPVGTKMALSADQIAHSKALKALFPNYVNGLGLKSSDGKALTLDVEGNGSFKDYIRSLLMESAQRAVNTGKDLSAQSWLKVQGGKVQSLDFEAYIRFAGRMKSTAVFDGLDLGTGENSLFGTSQVNAQHFTAYGQAHSLKPGSQADAGIVKLMNPMAYIGVPGATVANQWRIRHGTMDRDTSLAIPVILATRLASSGSHVDLALPWGQGHGGDYDLDELFAWVDKVCR